MIVPATIQLTQSTPSAINAAEQSVWPLNIQALGSLMPSEIFVYQVTPALDKLPGDRFQCVASVSELFELPVTPGAKDKKQLLPRLRPQHPHHPQRPKFEEFSIPFYRTANVEFNCRTPGEVLILWQIIQDAVQRLVDNFNQFQNWQSNAVVILSPSAIVGPAASSSIVQLFQLYVVNNQLVPQLLDTTTDLYHTLGIYNDGGTFVFQISDIGYVDTVSNPTGQILLSTFRLYPYNGQIVPQIMDTVTGLYHTIVIYNDSGILTLQISDQAFTGGPVSTSPGPGLTPLFRLYPLNGQNIPQLMDTTTGLYHQLYIYNSSGTLTLQVADQGY